MNKWLGAGLLAMLVGLCLLLAMVVGVVDPNLGLSIASYGLLFVGVFCFTAGVMGKR